MSESFEKNIPTVSAVVHPIKQHLERSFSAIMVQGEVSNLTSSAAGHWYFTLSDQEASLQCALFKQQAWSNPVIRQIKNGDKIFCQGGLSVYAKRGSFQLIADRLAPLGVGDLLAQFEKLKTRLHGLGLFNSERKRPIPPMPSTIAIVTAQTGAALQDFLNVYYRRSGLANVIVANALVQGQQAATSVMQALEKIKLYSQTRPIDVVVIARGGGSFEDLFCFNDENLIHYLANYPLPTVSAIGHQVDFTLCDFVADQRAETPTAAAEMLSAQQVNAANLVGLLGNRLSHAIERQLQSKRLRLSSANPRQALEKLLHKMQTLGARLRAFDQLKHPEKLLNLREHGQYIDELFARLCEASKVRQQQNTRRLEVLWHMLETLAPKKVLERGYTYMEIQGQVVSSHKNAKKLLLAKNPSSVSIVWADGKMSGEFQEKI